MKEWQELQQLFQTLLWQCERTVSKLDASFLYAPCHKAGKVFFEMLSQKNPFGLGDEFKKPPVMENLFDPDGRPYTQEHYAEYWLCVLGQLARTGQIIIHHWKLLHTKVPPLWGVLDHTEISFFSDRRAYITEVCNGSVQVCEKLLGPNAWQPPDGYIGSKAISVPRTTLQAWQERDKPDIKKDPKSHENYYPKEWLQKKLLTYKPKKSVT